MSDFNLADFLGGEDRAAELREAVLSGPQAGGWYPTAEELETYMRGHCHVLAIALHRRLGWPMVAIVDWGDEYSPGVPAVPHVMLEVPGEADLCIDINGWVSAGYFQDAVFLHDLYEPDCLWGLSENEVLQWMGESFKVPLMEVDEKLLEGAYRVAERLIDSLGLQEFDLARKPTLASSL